MIYQNRDHQVRSELTKEEALRQIEEKYQQKYAPDSTFDAWDQFLACEAVAESTPISPTFYEQIEPDEIDIALVPGNGIDSSKQIVKFELSPDKLQIISELKKCTAKTPPVDVEKHLDSLFLGYGTKGGWWLAVAQQWNPRAINRVIDQMIKLQRGGWKTIQNPAAYFTLLIKFRKKRRGL